MKLNVDWYNGNKTKRTWSCSGRSPLGSKSAHKLNLNESTVVEGGVSRVRVMTCSPESDVKSNMMFSVVTRQSEIKSDFAWIMFRTMTKIKARCRCDRRIMSGVSKDWYCVNDTLCSSIYMCLSIVFLKSPRKVRSSWLCRTYFQKNRSPSRQGQVLPLVSIICVRDGSVSVCRILFRC